MSFQESDSTIIMIGERKDELGGSLYYSLYGKLGANIPKPNLKEVRDQIFAVLLPTRGGHFLTST